MRREVEAYLDGEVRGADRITRIESHLDECATCRHDLDVLDRVKRSLRRIASTRPNDLTAARVRRWTHTLIR